MTSARLLRFWLMAAGANPTRSPKRGGHACGGVMTGGIGLPSVNHALHKRAPVCWRAQFAAFARVSRALVKPPQNVPAFCWPLTHTARQAENDATNNRAVSDLEGFVLFFEQTGQLLDRPSTAGQVGRQLR